MLRRRSRIIAISLSLLFSVKGLLPLWLHHWFHQSTAVVNKKGIPSASDKFQQACDCFNEAMLPLEKTAVFTLSIPIQKATELGIAPQIPVPAAEKIYYSLKGPPVPSLRS